MVVDTMVYAYALVGVTEYRDAAARTFTGHEPVLVPDSLWAELGNVMWQWVRRYRLEPAVAAALMEDAEALTDRTVSCEDLWRPALALAIEHDHPVYDTLFIALAQREKTHVATFDRRLAERFPAWTVAPQ